jgi:hypothetical protein
MNQKQKGMQPAFPAFPLQDQFGKFISPFPGMSKFEHIALTLYQNTKQVNDKYTIKDCFLAAITFMEIYEEFISKLDEEQKTKLQIIQ